VTTSDPFIGTLFGGRWLIERPLMSGGMGSVYVAKHTDTGRPVALKVIKSGSADDPNFVGRFRRETGALAAVSHPNVVGFLDSGLENGNLYLVMELLQGKPLRELMKTSIEWRRAFRIAADVCRALAAVHKLGIIHRDLKPENVFLQDSEGHDEFAKLIDFGIARLQEHEQKDQHEATATQTGVIVGTPGYISPEQLRGKPATPASDVYAVGVIVYELVTGVAPFGCMSTQEMLVRQLIDPIVPPIDHVKSLPLAVNAAILRLMERDAEHRVQSARDAITLLVDTMRTGESGPVEALPPSSKTEAVVVSAGGTLLQGSAPFIPPATSPTPAPPIATPAPAVAVPSVSSVSSVPSTTAPSATPAPVDVPLEPKVDQALITTALVDRAPTTTTKKKGRWGRRFLWAAALGVSALAIAWVANEGLRIPRGGDDVSAFYFRVLYPTGERIARVVSAGARAAHVEASGGSKKSPAPSPAQVEALVRRFSGELIQCGGDSRPRIVRATLHASGRIDAVTSPEDDAARCLRDRSRAWRSQAFDGNAVTVDVAGILFGIHPP
jgi:eukaryotic-like serine/threonine-protein kinase